MASPVMPRRPIPREFPVGESADAMRASSARRAPPRPCRVLSPASDRRIDRSVGSWRIASLGPALRQFNARGVPLDRVLGGGWGVHLRTSRYVAQKRCQKVSAAASGVIAITGPPPADWAP